MKFRFRLGVERPDEAWIGQQPPHSERDMDPRMPSLAASLKQQDCIMTIFGKARCQCRTGRAGTYDNEIISIQIINPRIYSIINNYILILLIIIF